MRRRNVMESPDWSSQPADKADHAGRGRRCRARRQQKHSTSTLHKTGTEDAVAHPDKHYSIAVINRHQPPPCAERPRATPAVSKPPPTCPHHAPPPRHVLTLAPAQRRRAGGAAASTSPPSWTPCPPPSAAPA
ncbi:hypothetical protein TPAR_00164, partial [Tolypocladium paradoxum]